MLVNPVIETSSDAIYEGWEGCLSVAGLRGVVPRLTHMRYSGFDHQGTAIEREAHDFHARVVQQGCDHLDGILYTQRMKDMSLFGFTQTLEVSGQPTPMFCEISSGQAMDV